MNNQDDFIKGRLKGVIYALRGTLILVRTEHSIILQCILAIISIGIGFYFGITKTEWMLQILGIGIILTAEGLNTAIEKLCDFVHPDFHSHIGKIKDLAAGAVTFAVLAVVMMAILIYYPYILEKFSS